MCEAYDKQREAATTFVVLNAVKCHILLKKSRNHLMDVNYAYKAKAVSIDTFHLS